MQSQTRLAGIRFVKRRFAALACVLLLPSVIRAGDNSMTDFPVLRRPLSKVEALSDLRRRILDFVKYLASDSGDTGVRATVNSASKPERIIMTQRQPVAEWRVSLWFVVLSPLLGILLALLGLFVFAN